MAQLHCFTAKSSKRTKIDCNQVWFCLAQITLQEAKKRKYAYCIIAPNFSRCDNDFNQMKDFLSNVFSDKIKSLSQHYTTGTGQEQRATTIVNCILPWLRLQRKGMSDKSLGLLEYLQWWPSMHCMQNNAFYVAAPDEGLPLACLHSCNLYSFYKREREFHAAAMLCCTYIFILNANQSPLNQTRLFCM